MKKIPFILLIMVAFIGCTKDDNPAKSEMVGLTLNYSFLEGGSMSRSGDAFYADFYDKYIKTKILTPKRYDLTFRNIKDGSSTSISGQWSNKDMIRLLEGDYIVTGFSLPSVALTSPTYGDTASLSFNDTISITKATTNINLTANYASLMLFFDKDNYQSIYVQYNANAWNNFTVVKKDLIKSDNFYYLFNADNFLNNDYIIAKRADNSTIEIGLYNMPFEVGKYYYFNDITSSFDLAPMTAGN